ncbi:MAG: ATP-grasp domain-containing protein, partial [Candidatus Nomurabacteria bacterium]|nr:ATP-grasp domain-containing protein [Candidatus Nomurabacteria bacterium]
KYGIFIGGLQKQLVNSRYLCNVEQKGSTKWCGGEVGGLYSDIVSHRTREIATIIGSELSSRGYRGVFGIDLIVTPDEDVYAIEVNARLTGYSHVLSDMQFAKQKIPFMLLHTLELGNIPYEIEDLEALPMPSSLDETYSYLIVVNENDGDYILNQELKSGIYKIAGNSIEFERPGYSVVDIKNNDELIILSKFSKKGDVIERGKRIYKIIIKGRTIDDSTGDLNEMAQRVVINTRRGLGITTGGRI